MNGEPKGLIGKDVSTSVRNLILILLSPLLVALLFNTTPKVIDYLSYPRCESYKIPPSPHSDINNSEYWIHEKNTKAKTLPNKQKPTTKLS